MKTIIFVRHAKSSWTDESLSDFDRPLDTRGLHDAPIMAEKLKSFIPVLEMIISSPANRALSTARYFADKYGAEISIDRELYHGLPDNYLDAIRELEENTKSVALFGHNPGLTFLANLIKPKCTDNLSTCGIIIAQAPDSIRWNKIRFSDMNLVQILFPKMHL
ncbi:MAG: histidine phosphatase family protein [Saprospiraceae bacterium]|nr:histidine phosphatase family protein [Saprospiraceae bacterium]